MFNGHNTQYLFLLTFFSSCCLYFDYKLFIIPLICFIKIIFSNVRYKFKVLSVIFYTLFSIPFFSLLFLWGDIFPPTVQPIHHVGSILFLNHPGYAISIIAFYLAPILFFKKQKIFYLFQNVFLNRNYQYLIAVVVIYILFLFFIYEVPIVGFHQDIGKGYMYKISLMLFDEVWLREIFISISILICWFVILAFLNSKILDWLVILYFLLASISIYPLLQEYFDPLIILMALVLNYGYKPIQVDGDSMAETFIDGDKFLVNKLSYRFFKPEKGDVVVFYDYKDDCLLVKRIVGMPYDTVEIISGVILINDEPLLDEFSHLVVAEDIIIGSDFTLGKVMLREGEYWCIGDNRAATWFGVVYEDEILGFVD